jgi:hypothetical protein
MTTITQQLLFDSIEGDSETGGWTASCSSLNAQNIAEYGRHVSIYHCPEGGGRWSDDYLLALDGTMFPKSIRWDRGQSATDVVVSTSHAFLQNAGVQGIYFSRQSSPSNPHQMTNLTLGRIVYHIVRYHTNLADWVDLSGIDVEGSTAVDVYTVRESNSIWDTLKSIASNEFYVVYFTRTDRLMYRPHPMFDAAPPPPVVTLDRTCIIGQPSIEYRDMVFPDQVQLYALTDTGQILQAFYPSNMGAEGRRHRVTNIRCNSQSRLNTLASRLYQYLRKRFTLTVTLPGSWGLNLELYDRVAVTYSGTASNGVQFNWNQKKFWITSIRVTRLHQFGAVSEITLEEENLEG